MMNYQQLQCTPPERQMRSKIPPHLLTTTLDSSKPSKKYIYNLNTSQFESTLSPNVSPGPRPIIRPIPSPMTPITPLVLTESHYQKEFLHSSIDESHDPNEYGYFYHGNNIQHYQSSLSQLPHQYTCHNQNGYPINYHKTPTQPSSSLTPSSPSPLSSGASTPTCSTFFSSSYPNQFTILNNYGDQDSLHPNVVNADGEDGLCHNNASLTQPSRFANFDSGDEGDMVKNLLITNPLDADFCYQNPHHEYQQKSQYEMVIDGVEKCKNGDVNVHGMPNSGGAHYNNLRNGDLEHPMSMDATDNSETMVNNNRTSSQHDDIQFREILKGMDKMDIVDFH